MARHDRPADPSASLLSDSRKKHVEATPRHVDGPQLTRHGCRPGGMDPSAGWHRGSVGTVAPYGLRDLLFPMRPE